MSSSPAGRAAPIASRTGQRTPEACSQASALAASRHIGASRTTRRRPLALIALAPGTIWKTIVQRL